jgi:hypothetical protein
LKRKKRKKRKEKREKRKEKREKRKEKREKRKEKREKIWLGSRKEVLYIFDEFNFFPFNRKRKP